MEDSLSPMQRARHFSVISFLQVLPASEQAPLLRSPPTAHLRLQLRSLPETAARASRTLALQEYFLVHTRAARTSSLQRLLSDYSPPTSRKAPISTLRIIDLTRVSPRPP